MSHIDPVIVERCQALRHKLHSKPELSRQERKTKKRILAYLEKHAKPDQVVPLAGKGFAAVYDGDKPGKTILIRAELDALPIQEAATDLPYKSKRNGVAHLCGHDGHSAILCGVAEHYSKKSFRGRLVLLWQPDEETGTGAKSCVNHKNFAHVVPDFAFALHNFPENEAHSVLCRAGVFTSAIKFMAFKLTGKVTHSALPEKGVSPAEAIAEITLAAKSVQSDHESSDHFALVVPIHMHMGVSSSGVCPGRGELHVAIRSSSDDIVDAMWCQLRRKAGNIAAKYSLVFETEEIESFATTCNDPSAVDMVRKAASDIGLEYLELPEPFRAGEDYGEIVRRVPGPCAMFGLGAGEHTPQLHSPDYDFPDELIPTGIAMFDALIQHATST